MSMRWYDGKHDDHFADNYEEDMNINWEDEIENASSKSARRQIVKRKLEDQMDKRRIRWEIDDYEQELDEGFDWGDSDNK